MYAWFYDTREVYSYFVSLEWSFCGYKVAAFLEFYNMSSCPPSYSSFKDSRKLFNVTMLQAMVFKVRLANPLKPKFVYNTSISHISQHDNCAYVRGWEQWNTLLVSITMWTRTLLRQVYCYRGNTSVSIFIVSII